MNQLRQQVSAQPGLISDMVSSGSIRPKQTMIKRGGAVVTPNVARSTHRPARYIDEFVRPRPHAQIKLRPATQPTETPKLTQLTAMEPITKDDTEQTLHKITEKKPDNSRENRPKLTIAEHLQELRSRLLWSALALLFGGALGYVYHEQVIAILVKPLNQQLYYTSPAGGFDFLVKTCVFFGFILAIPVLVYQLLKFLSPAIPKHITYKTGRILLISTLLAIAGACFAYFISLPAALHFLSNFSTGSVTSLISANEYFNFVMIYVACFALLFQMPLIIAFINKITPLTPRLLMKKQRFVILGSFIVAAIITPTPDPLNQTLMALPIIGLYQSSIGVVWQSNRRTRKKSHRRQMATNGYSQPVAA